MLSAMILSSSLVRAEIKRMGIFVVSRNSLHKLKPLLFEKVWGDKFTGDGTLNVHIRRLREAIEINPNEPKYVVTVWGDGYKFADGKK